jgi:hypothetical protein
MPAQPSLATRGFPGGRCRAGAAPVLLTGIYRLETSFGS